MKRFLKLLVLMSVLLSFTFATYASSPDLYIQWEVNTIKVTFNANGGSGTMSPQTIKYGDDAKLNNNEFTKDGYFFMGWSESPDGEIIYNNREPVESLVKDNYGDLALYAQWGVKEDIDYATGVDNVIPGIYYADDYDVVSLRGTLMYSWDELIKMGLDIEKDLNEPQSVSSTSTNIYSPSNFTCPYAATTVLACNPIPGTNRRIQGQIIFPPDVDKIGDFQFYHAFALKGKLTIPEGIKYIGQSIFDYASTPTNGLIGDLIIPDSVRLIGATAFWGMTNMTGTLKIGKGCWGIAFEAFGGDCAFTKVEIPSSVVYIGTGQSSSIPTRCPTTLNIPSDITFLPAGMFSHCSASSIVVPNSITSFKSSIRSNYYGMFSCSSINSITIPSSVTFIGNGNFYSCSNLSSVTFKTTSGWKAGGTSVSLTNTSTNATYLKSTYSSSNWTRN